MPTTTDPRSGTLEVRGLRKAFGALVAVDGVSFSVAPGTIVGLLGPNGAGKTTIVSVISGLLVADAGSVTLGGRALDGDTDPLKLRIGLVPQELALYEDLTAEDNLHFFGALYGLAGKDLHSRSGAVLALAGLTDRRRERVKRFSGGMKRRLNMAASLLHDPDFLLLDEPTVGVDPQSRNALFDTIEELKRAGKTIVYTTHYMEEAERLCDRIVIVDHGHVLADDTLAGLVAKAPAGASGKPARLEEIFLALTGRALRDE